MVDSQPCTGFSPRVTIKCMFLTLCLITCSAVLLYSAGTVFVPRIENIKPIDLIKPTNLTKPIDLIKPIGLDDNFNRRWRKVGQSDEGYVFSAYYKRFEHVVEMVGIVKRSRLNSIFNCMFQEGVASDGQYRYTAALEYIHLRKNLVQFETLFIRCAIPLDINPSTVTFEMDNSSTTLPIVYPQTARNIYNLSVCFPSFFRFQYYQRLIDAIESNILLGVQFFTVYNHSVTDKVDKVFKHYEALGLMEVIEWEPPQNTDVHYDGQWSHIQDCTLSHRYKSKYVMILDADELIVPHKHTNLLDLIRDLEKDGKYSAGSYVFRNAFFDVHVDDNSSFPQRKDVEQLQITSLRYVWRSKIDHGPKYRSKAIVSPPRVHTAGIHFTAKMGPGFSEHLVDPEMGFLHHYRRLTKVKNGTKDDFMRKYTRRLVPIVKRVHSVLGFI